MPLSLTFREQLPPIVAQELDLLIARIQGTINDTANLSTILAQIAALQATVTGFVTHASGSLTADEVVLGNGTKDVRTLGDLGTTTKVLHGNAAGAPTFAAVNLATDVTGTLPLASVATLAAGVYTPTLTDAVNIAAHTAYDLQYLRVGNVVTVSGKVSIDPTAAGDVQLGISLPVASNFGNDYEAGGTAVAYAVAEHAAIYADAANDRLTLRFTAVSTANNVWFFTATYKVI